jgi:hypothetical protein
MARPETRRAPAQTTNAGPRRDDRPRVVWGLYRRTYREYEPAWALADRVYPDLRMALVELREGRQWVLIGDGIGQWRPGR